MTDSLQLLLVSDVHHGPEFEAKAGPKALSELRSVVRRLEDEAADTIVDLGDRINNSDLERDAQHMLEVAAVFATSTKQRYHLLGNHDVKLLSPADNERLLRQPVASRVVARQGWTLILWSPPPLFRRDGCVVPAADIRWLREAVDQLTGPAVLFTHVPLGGGSMRGNYYFEGDPAAGATYLELPAIQELLLATDNLKLVVSGHVHWNSVNTIDGLPFLTIQSLSELATTSPHPAGAWARLTLQNDAARLEVMGRDGFDLRVPLRQAGRHWLRRPGLPTFKASGALAEPSESQGVILDLDGVIYRGNELLPGAREFVAALRSLDKRLLAVSNHSGHTSAGLAKKLADLGVQVSDDEVMTSVDAVLAYLCEFWPDAAVMVVGSQGLKRVLADAGFEFSEEPDVVVLGYQAERDLAEFAVAAAAIAAGAALVATNEDAWLPSANGERGPETGPFVALLAALAGRRPEVVVGKPNATIGQLALKRLGLPPETVLVVGDTLATDVALAKTIGATSALVLTGNTAEDDLLVPSPDFVYKDLLALTEALTN